MGAISRTLSFHLDGVIGKRTSVVQIEGPKSRCLFPKRFGKLSQTNKRWMTSYDFDKK